jgi:hypothetical protein
MISVGYLVLETVHVGIFALWCVFTTLFVVHKFYKFGSDPMNAKSAQENQVSLKSSVQLTSASENSCGVNVSVSYVSPSRTILESIKCFNASSARSGDANAAAESASLS